MIWLPDSLISNHPFPSPAWIFIIPAPTSCFNNQQFISSQEQSPHSLPLGYLVTLCPELKTATAAYSSVRLFLGLHKHIQPGLRQQDDSNDQKQVLNI